MWIAISQSHFHHYFSSPWFITVDPPLFPPEYSWHISALASLTICVWQATLMGHKSEAHLTAMHMHSFQAHDKYIRVNSTVVHKNLYARAISRPNYFQIEVFNWKLSSSLAHCKAVTLPFFFFGIIILYRDHIYYMYRALWEVIIGGGGGYNSKRQSLATLRSLGQRSWPGEDRSQRLILHRAVKVKLCQGVGPPPQCTAAGSDQRLVYSSPTIHVVPPLACMGLGNIKCESRFVRL
jgi:hypothetical protein